MGVLPGWLEEQWRTAYRRSAARNVLVMRAVARIVAQLSGAGVPLLLLKGCALAVSGQQRRQRGGARAGGRDMHNREIRTRAPRGAVRARAATKRGQMATGTARSTGWCP